MFQVVLLTFAFSLAVSLYLWYRNIWSYKGLDKLPTPPLLPLLGHGRVYMKAGDIYGVLRVMTNVQKKLGGIVLMWSLRMAPYILLTDVNIVQYFMRNTKHIAKAWEYTLLEPWLKKGLLTSKGSKWHSRRKLLTPAFHFKILKEFVDTIHTNGNILVEKLSENIGTKIDIHRFINLYALDVICETAMGTSINVQIDENSDYLKAIRTYLTLISNKLHSLWILFPRIYKLTFNAKKEQEALTIMHNFTMSIIEKRREELLKNKLDFNASKPKRKLAFLDLLLEATEDDRPLSNEDVREEVDTFMFEGNDTVSSALSFLLFELAKVENQHVQQKVHDEICEILGENKNKLPTIAQLQMLTYVELVIKEGLRLYPSVPIILRELEEDTIIDSSTTGGKQLNFPKGASLLINVYAIHRNEEIYPEPEKFIPERFLKDNWLDKSPFAYLPFSAGPRNCIGQKFAMLEIKATLTKILLNFKLTQVYPTYVPEVYSDGVLKSRQGLPIIMLKRD